MPAKGEKAKTLTKGKRYYFFLSPYRDTAFTRCPKCRGKTKQRKFALVIHIEPRQPCLMNKVCRFCPYCDLIIAKQEEVEALLTATFEKTKPDIVGNEYFIFGTLEKADWRYLSKGEHPMDELIKHTLVFKDVWNFTPAPAGWSPPDQDKGKPR